MPRRILEGVVTSNVREKTVTVKVTRRVMHPRYKKYINVAKKYHAHDEKNECNIGDKVEIAETRHLSKDKYFRLVRIIEKAK